VQLAVYALMQARARPECSAKLCQRRWRRGVQTVPGKPEPFAGGDEWQRIATLFGGIARGKGNAGQRHRGAPAITAKMAGLWPARTSGLARWVKRPKGGGGGVSDSATGFMAALEPGALGGWSRPAPAAAKTWLLVSPHCLRLLLAGAPPSSILAPHLHPQGGAGNAPAPWTPGLARTGSGR